MKKGSKAFHLHHLRLAGQWSSGGTGKALDLISTPFSSGLTPKQGRENYQEIDLLELAEGFERDHTKMRLQDSVRVA